MDKEKVRKLTEEEIENVIGGANCKGTAKIDNYISKEAIDKTPENVYVYNKKL